MATLSCICLENSMGSVWQATAHEVAKSWTQLNKSAHVHKSILIALFSNVEGFFDLWKIAPQGSFS